MVKFERWKIQWINREKDGLVVVAVETFTFFTSPPSRILIGPFPFSLTAHWSTVVSYYAFSFSLL